MTQKLSIRKMVHKVFGGPSALALPLILIALLCIGGCSFLTAYKTAKTVHTTAKIAGFIDSSYLKSMNAKLDNIETDLQATTIVLRFASQFVNVLSSQEETIEVPVDTVLRLHAIEGEEEQRQWLQTQIDNGAEVKALESDGKTEQAIVLGITPKLTELALGELTNQHGRVTAFLPDISTIVSETTKELGRLKSEGTLEKVAIANDLRKTSTRAKGMETEAKQAKDALEGALKAIRAFRSSDELAGE
ncbi:hypothetical protein IH992_34350 [Candidatus Poribacteria bacterium]|nr:hypothetical protein [Candidatus Poribacteria bacterium]